MHQGDVEVNNAKAPSFLRVWEHRSEVMLRGQRNRALAEQLAEANPPVYTKCKR